ncbi:MAG: hypothetical protein ABSA47_05060, partial [Verrucomicrobiota bacterium]
PAVLGANLGADFDAFPEKGGRLSDLVPATGMGAWLVGVQIGRRISPHRVPKNLETQEVYVSTAVFRIMEAPQRGEVRRYDWFTDATRADGTGFQPLACLRIGTWGVAPG